MQADIVRDAALAGNTEAARFLCGNYVNVTPIEDPGSPGFVSLELRGAIYLMVVAQPPGCSLQQGALFQRCNVEGMHSGAVGILLHAFILTLMPVHSCTCKLSGKLENF